MTLFNGEELPDPGQIDISLGETVDVLSRISSMSDEEFEEVWKRLGDKIHEARFYRQVLVSAMQALETIRPVLATLRTVL